MGTIWWLRLLGTTVFGSFGTTQIIGTIWTAPRSGDWPFTPGEKGSRFFIEAAISSLYSRVRFFSFNFSLELTLWFSSFCSCWLKPVLENGFQSFCSVQLTIFQLAQRVAQSLYNSWASCITKLKNRPCEPTRWAKKVEHYVWKLTSSAYIFKMPESISMIFGICQQHFILNTYFYSTLCKLIIQSGAT